MKPKHIVMITAPLTLVIIILSNVLIGYERYFTITALILSSISVLFAIKHRKGI